MMKKSIGIIVLGLLVVIIALGVIDRFFVSTIKLIYDNDVIELNDLKDHDDPFKGQVNDKTKLVALGDNLTLELDHRTVESIEVNDYILDERGYVRYNDLDEYSIEITRTDKGYDLKVNPHVMILLSSALEDKIYRGIELTLIEEDKTISYLFVIQTEAFDN